MPDQIALRGMQFYAYHGADPGERVLGQRFEVDVELAADLSTAGNSDRLEDAVNYRDVYELVRDAMEPPCLLLEAVAERIAQLLLAGFAIDSVTVRVRKPSVPIGGVLACAEVTVTRARVR